MRGFFVRSKITYDVLKSFSRLYVNVKSWHVTCPTIFLSKSSLKKEKGYMSENVDVYTGSESAVISFIWKTYKNQ